MNMDIFSAYPSTWMVIFCAAVVGALCLNSLLKRLYSEVREGYVVYLDDDKRFADAFAVTRLLARLLVRCAFLDGEHHREVLA